MYKLCFLALFALATATSPPYNYQEPQAVHHTQPTVHHQQQQTSHNEGFKKEYYYFNAPEEHIEHNAAPLKKVTQQQVKKNLQVIFIKPPEEKHHHKAVQNLVQQNQATETKTHIYVLQPEPHHAAASKKVQHVQQATVQHHKPEVHYLKYHTPAEAQSIQHKIIQQYGGKPSEIVQSGSAPVVSFINSGHQEAPVHQHETSASVNRQYLAPLY